MLRLVVGQLRRVWLFGFLDAVRYRATLYVACWKRKAGRKDPARQDGAHEEGSVRENAIRREYPETTCAEGC